MNANALLRCDPHIEPPVTISAFAGALEAAGSGDQLCVQDRKAR
jgi:hypothetical protein